MFAPRQGDHSLASPRDSERGYGFKKGLEAVKAVWSVVDEADLLCGPAGQRTGLRRVGDRWVGACPARDHADRTPSFTVYPSENRWWCYGCNRGGDVLDLHQLAHGYAKKSEALLSLSAERGVELPRRPQSWRDWQKTKYDIRDVAEEARKIVRRERLFKCLVLTGPEFQIEDEAERRRAVGRAWKVFEEGMRRIGQ